LRWALSAALAGAGISVIVTLLATGFFRQRDLKESVSVLTQRAETAEALARDEANRTQRAREQAAELINYFTSSLQSELEPIGRTDILERAVREAEAYFESLPPNEQGSDFNVNLAKLRFARAQAHYAQGKFAESESAYRDAIRLVSETLEGELANDESINFLLNDCYNELALTLSGLGKEEEARASSEAALEICEKFAKVSQHPNWSHGIAASTFGIAEVTRSVGDPADAIPLYDQALSVIEDALAVEPDSVHYLSSKMFSHTNRAYCLSETGAYDEAVKGAESASAIAERLIELEPERRKWKKEYATLVNNLGSMLDDRGEHERAKPLVEKARQLRKELVAFDPVNAGWRRDLANSEHNLTMNHLEKGDVEKAWDSERRYLDHVTQLLRQEPDNESWHRDVIEYTNRQADSFEKNNAHLAAAEIYETIGRLYGELFSGDPDELHHLRRRAKAVQRAADVWRHAGNFQSSLEHYKLALDLRLESLHRQPGDPEAQFEVGVAMSNYALGFINLKKYSEALRYLQFAYAIYQKAPEGFENREKYMALDAKSITKAQIKLGLMDKPANVIKRGAMWQYWDAGEAPAPGWSGVDFDADAWSQGAAQLGYGEGDEKTEISFGGDKGDKHMAAYFRHEFEIVEAEAAQIESLHISLVRDDGAVVYLNGKEIARDFMPEGEIEFRTPAVDFVPNDIEQESIWIDVPEGVGLRAGKNVVAVEIHQSDRASSDLSFDMELFKNAPRPDPLKDFDAEGLKELLDQPEG